MPFFILYNLLNDFPNGLDNIQLSNEISLQFPTFLQIQVSDEKVYVLFSTNQSNNKSILDGVIASHNPSTGIDFSSSIASIVSERSSGAGPNNAGFSNILFDQKRFENIPSILEYDIINPERILVKETNSYDISYTAVCKNSQCKMRILINDTTIVDGSEQEATPGSSTESIITCRTIVNIEEGSYITCQLYSPEGDGELIPGTTFIIVSQKALKGESGPTGPQGASGTGSGDVLGVSLGSTNNAIALFDGATGRLLKNSNVIIDEFNTITTPSSINSSSITVNNLPIGADGHFQLKAGSDYSSDTYSHGLDINGSNRIIASVEEGIYRNSVLLSGKSHNADSNIFGVNVSSNSGGTWEPCISVKQGCKIGICNSNPSTELDVIGDMSISGVINGRNINLDGIAQDNHIADTTIHRTINDSGTENTDLWSASKIISELNSQVHVSNDITDFNTSVDNRINIQKGSSNGLATLDSSGKIPTSQLNVSSVTYQGTWNALINIPVITDGVGNKGDYYVISTAGDTNIDGINEWEIGDWIIFNGNSWEKVDNTDAVISVAGKKGNIALDASDIMSGVFSNDRISEASVIQHESKITIGNLIEAPNSSVVGISDHQNLTNKIIDSSTNIITSDKIRNIDGTVSIYTSSAPLPNQVLMATSSTEAKWQNTCSTSSSINDLELPVFDGNSGQFIKGSGIKFYQPSLYDPISSSLSNGDTYYNTSLSQLMLYDINRGKWLSMSTLTEGCGSKKNVSSGKYYKRYGDMTTSESSGSLIQKGTIIYVSCVNSKSAYYTFEILVNNVVIAEFYSGGASAIQDFNVNVDFNSGIISFRNKDGSDNCSNFQATILYKLRA